MSDGQTEMKRSIDDATPEEWNEVSRAHIRALRGAAPLEVQAGGNHYKDFAIQPVEYIHANNLSFLQGNAIKYITRYKLKGGKADLEKAIHCIELIIDMEKL